jgi:hypothetical protein
MKRFYLCLMAGTLLFGASTLAAEAPAAKSSA